MLKSEQSHKAIASYGRSKHRSLSRNCLQAQQAKQNEYPAKLAQHGKHEKKEVSISRHSSQIAFRRRIRNNALRDVKNLGYRVNDSKMEKSSEHAEIVSRHETQRIDKENKLSKRKACFWTKHVPGAQIPRMSQQNFYHKRYDNHEASQGIQQSSSPQKLEDTQQECSGQISHSFMSEIDTKFDLIHKYQTELRKQSELVCFRKQFHNRIESCSNYFNSYCKALKMLNQTLANNQLLPKLISVIDNHLSGTSMLFSKVRHLVTDFMEHHHNEELIHKFYEYKERNQYLEHQLINKENQIAKLVINIDSLSNLSHKKQRCSAYHYPQVRGLDIGRLCSFLRSNYIVETDSKFYNQSEDSICEQLVRKIISHPKHTINHVSAHSNQYLHKPVHCMAKPKRQQMRPKTRINSRQKLRQPISNISSIDLQLNEQHSQSVSEYLQEISYSRNCNDSVQPRTSSLARTQMEIIACLAPQIMQSEEQAGRRRCNQGNLALLKKLYTLKQSDQKANSVVLLHQILTASDSNQQFEKREQYDQKLMGTIIDSVNCMLSQTARKGGAHPQTKMRMFEIITLLEEHTLVSNAVSRKQIIKNILKRTKTTQGCFINQQFIDKLLFRKSTNFSSNCNTNKLREEDGQNEPRYSMIQNKRLMNCMEAYGSKLNNQKYYNEYLEGKQVVNNSKRIGSCKSETLISLMNNWAGISRENTQSDGNTQGNSNDNKQSNVNKQGNSNKQDKSNEDSHKITQGNHKSTQGNHKMQNGTKGTQLSEFPQNNKIEQAYFEVSDSVICIEITQCYLVLYFYVRQQLKWLNKALMADNSFCPLESQRNPANQVSIAKLLQLYFVDCISMKISASRIKQAEKDIKEIITRTWLIHKTHELIKPEQEQIRAKAIAKTVCLLKDAILGMH